jgi:DNA-binding helix-hairpin-helix protein with protein kinase domain
MRNLRDSSRNAVLLGDLIQSGGEGTVHAVHGRPAVVAKVFHRVPPDSALQKLKCMVSMRNAVPEGVSAWPLDVVQDGAGVIRGFLMERVDGHVVDSAVHPGMQRMHFPRATYGFLLHLAANIMEAAAELHRAGVVIGDVNERNIMVRPDATVRFIDTDSFQIAMPNGVGLCTVGTAIYTPAELQGKDFATVPRTTNHDLFGLAILIFQLLMLGRHPFAGIPRDRQFGGSIEEAIRVGAFAYAESLRTPLMRPPDSLPLRALGPLEPMFERAFLKPARPTAKEWTAALRDVRARQAPCHANPRHSVLAPGGGCPLCRLPREPFAGTAPQRAQARVTVHDVLREVAQLADPPRLDAMLREPDPAKALDTTPMSPSSISPEDQAFLARRVGSAVPAVLGMVVLPVAGVWLVIGGGGWGWIVLLGGCAQAVKCGRIVADARRRRRLRRKIGPYLNQRSALARELDEHRHLERRISSLEGCLAGRLERIRNAAHSQAEYLRLRLLDPEAPFWLAEGASREEWRAKQLAQAFVRDSGIPGIGPERVAALQSFGIESAADVSEAAIKGVPGFGALMTERLVNWRRSVEQVIAQAAPPPTPAGVLQVHASAYATAVREGEQRVRKEIDEYQSALAAARIELQQAAERLNNERARLWAMAERLRRQ